jgi:hypothetical protein
MGSFLWQISAFIVLAVLLWSGAGIWHFTLSPFHHMESKWEWQPVKAPSVAESIVQRAFNLTFAHLSRNCGKNQSIKSCCQNESKSGDPWWFQSMMRDMSRNVLGRWQSASNVTYTGEPIKLCGIEKIGTKKWKRLFCLLQNRTFERGQTCRPIETVSQDAVKIVFLRDPLERFLSAFIDKCIVHKGENHCEPVLSFFQGIDKKSLFEAHVNAAPLKWNVHFFPQSLYCDGLYRDLHSYDFIGRMGPAFFQDLDKLGSQFGDKLTEGLEQIFSVSQKLNDSNQGIETSASSHVKEFYTPATVRQVLEYTAIDYMLLDLPIPNWAETILNEDNSGHVYN